MPWSILLVILVVILLFGGFHGYSGGYYSGTTPAPGYYFPGMSIGGILILILIFMLLTGRL